MLREDVDDAVSRGARLNQQLDKVEPVAVPLALGVLVVAGVAGVLWAGIGDAMKEGLAVAILGVPLLFLYRSVHRQSTLLAKHIAGSDRPAVLTVSLYEGLKAMADIERGTRPDAMLFARTGSRYLSDLRNIDPQWDSLTVVLTDDREAGVWSSRPLDRGWAHKLELLISEAPSDIHYLVVGDDSALFGYFHDYGSGRVDYSQSLLVTESSDGGRELVTSLKRHFANRRRHTRRLETGGSRSSTAERGL